MNKVLESYLINAGHIAPPQKQTPQQQIKEKIQPQQINGFNEIINNKPSRKKVIKYLTEKLEELDEIALDEE